MSTTTGLFRYVVRLLPQTFKKPVLPPRHVCCAARPSASFPMMGTRSFSCGHVKHQDKSLKDDNSFESQMGIEDVTGEHEQTDENEYENSIRERILNASLDHVLDCGWTQEALEAGALSEGLPPIAHGMFAKGGADIIHHFYRKCNSELAEYLRTKVEEIKADEEKTIKTTPFIKDALEKRLRMIIPYHSIWKEAMAVQALPQNAPEAWNNLSNLCDDIWYFAGDKSVDFDWYTKRFTLAAVYKATEIYMLQDSSPDYVDTWVFLDKRLNDLNCLKDVKRSLAPLKEGVEGLFEMGRNMMGINSRNR